MAKNKDRIMPLDEARKLKKKKDTPPTVDNGPLNKQVMGGDTITIAEVKQFITDAKKGTRADFMTIAERSWNEIERRNSKTGTLYGVNNVTRNNRWARFPLWWSCWKIRQPITLARIPIPVLKDTQGDDSLGRSACIVGERLTRGILKTFEMFPELACSNDDFLIVNFGWGRVFYRSEICEEPEKVRLQVIQPPQPQEMEQASGANPQESPQQPPEPQPPIFLTPDGQQVDQSEVLDDDDGKGPYMLTGATVSVENEEVYWESQLYSNLYIEPGVRRWNKVTKLAIEYQYSYREFVEKFGQDALDKLASSDLDDHKTGKKPITCFEYWDRFLKEVRWFAENSNDFFQPSDMDTSTEGLQEVEDKEGYDNSDLYGLSGFFPCSEPLIINQSTKSFWPTPEYFQISDLLNDINSIVARMIQLTKAIRVRFFFDSSVDQLKSLISENWSASEGDGLGVPNLQQVLMNNQGDLSALVAYFPVDKLIEGLKNMYEAFQQRLDMYFRVTGISDLIQGQTNPDSDKTFGERQMEGKFALNRIEPFQRKVQEWIKDQYQLLMEMGLKMFSDQTLDDYITPETLEDEHKRNYEAALLLLKDNRRRRFRVDFETDSTIAINQEYRIQQATNLANTLTKALESTANVAQTMPELAGTELEVLKNLMSEFADGKLFIDDIKESIDQVIQKVSQPKPPPFDKDQADNQLEMARLNFDQQKAMTDDKFNDLKLQSSERIEMAKLQQATQFESIQAQIDQFKINSDLQAKGAQLAADDQEKRAELQLKYQEINASIAETREKMGLQREALMVELRKIVSANEVAQFQVMIDERSSATEGVLQKMQLDLNKTKIALETSAHIAEQARQSAEELRLEREHGMAIHGAKLDAVHSLVDAALKVKEINAPYPTDATPNAGLPTPGTPQKPMTRISTVNRDESGNIKTIVHKTISDGE